MAAVRESLLPLPCFANQSTIHLYDRRRHAFGAIDSDHEQWQWNARLERHGQHIVAERFAGIRDEASRRLSVSISPTGLSAGTLSGNIQIIVGWRFEHSVIRGGYAYCDSASALRWRFRHKR